MHAVIQTGGKQYRIQAGQKIKIEKLPVEVGDTVTFDQVLMLSQEGKCQIGSPLLKGAAVTATVLNQSRHDKIHIIKFKRRKHHMKRQGHRQYYTEIEIKDIKGAQ